MSLLGDQFPFLLSALWMTLGLALAAFVLGSALGAVIALARLTGPRVVQAVCWVYVAIFRGTPLLVQIFLIYFGLPQIGLDIPPIQSAILALTLYGAAYLSENFRAAIVGVDRGQWEAAASLGMSYGASLRRVIVPQAVRIATPSVFGQFTHLVKDTSLASVITVVELTQAAQRVGTATFQYMEAFIVVAGVYLLINTLLTLVQGLLERRMGRAYT